MSDSHTARCYKCNAAFEYEPTGKVSRAAECAACKTSLRCCKMCKFYDSTAYNECHEPVAERIVDKEKPNFCEYFSVHSGMNAAQDKDAKLAAAMALFKK